MDTLDGDNKANTLQIVNIQESINIQAEHVKKVDAERQLNEAKAKEDLEAAVADNERAISEMRNELGNSIVEKFKPTEDKLNGIDSQVQILNKSVTFFESRHAETVEKFKEVNVITNTIQTQMKEQEQKMVEQSANGLNKIKEQLNHIENQTDLSSQEIESLKKKSQELSVYLDQQLATFEDVMDKQINTDIMPRIGSLNDKISNFEKYIESSLESNAKAISDVRTDVTNSIQEKFKPTEDKIDNMDATIQDVNKIIGIFETRHVETVEKIKEISTVTKNINTQMKVQEQKIIQQSTDDLNKIREQLSDIENKARFSGQKIEELDSGNQTLQEKVSTIENQMAERLQDLANSDTSLSARIDGIELNNNQNIHQLTSDLEKSLSSNTTALESRMNNIDTKNNTLQIVDIQESINIQSEHVKKMDAERQQSETKAKKDLEGSVAANKRAIDELRNELIECVSEKIQPTENKVRDIDSEIHVINKTVSVMESRHVETVQKLKEVTVITNNVQTQVQAQEQKMVEQSANELNQVR